MILIGILLAKIATVIFAVFLVVRLFRKRVQPDRLVFLCLLCIVFGLVAHQVSLRIHPLREKVVLTALNEVGEKSQTAELFFEGSTVDGQRYMPENAVEGKWFWIGASYCWRPETDLRQPEGTTRSVTVTIPVGWERGLHFLANEWHGWVEVRDSLQTQRVDTSVTSYVPIASSGTRALLLSNLRQLMGYVLVAALLVGALAVVVKASLDAPERTVTWFRAKRAYLLLGVISLLQLLFAMRYAGTDGLWYDEITQIAFSINRSGSLLDQLMIGSAPMPLSTFIWRVLYGIMPYGEKWILLASELATAGGIYVIGLCGKNLKGWRCGLLAALFSACSKTLLVQASYEARSYGFFFFGATMLLYFYQKRLRLLGRENGKQIFILSIVMTFFVQMHYVGVPFCVGLFCIDFVLFVQKKVKLRCIVPYLVAALSYVPGLLYISQHRVFDQWHFAEWQPVPEGKHVVALLQYLTSHAELLYLLLLIGTASICVTLLYHWRYGEEECSAPLGFLTTLFIPVFLISAIFLFGHLNTKASLWVERYFICLIPCLMLICAMGCDWLFSLAVQRTGQGKKAASVLLSAILLMLVPAMLIDMKQAATTVRQTFREAADYIYTQGNYIYNDDTLIVMTVYPIDVMGWSDYYITHKGERDRLNVASQINDLDLAKLTMYSRIYVVYCQYGISPELMTALEANYQLTEQHQDIQVAVYDLVSQ